MLRDLCRGGQELCFARNRAGHHADYVVDRCRDRRAGRLFVLTQHNYHYTQEWRSFLGPRADRSGEDVVCELGHAPPEMDHRRPGLLQTYAVRVTYPSAERAFKAVVRP